MPNAAPDPLTLIPPPDPALVARFREALDRQRPPLPQDRIGIAVSGGPDSLALLLLAHAALPDRIEAATVDHGLRAESADETLMVAEVSARLGVPHATLKGAWNSDVKEGLQAAARAYRYRELTAWCVGRRLALLATAHHADDQAETLLMRLARGSGVGGLGSIRRARTLEGSCSLADKTGPDPPIALWPITLVRPLLALAKRDLVAIVGNAGIAFVDDPSNDSDRFDRTRARRLLADTDWLDPRRLADAADHLADADDALDWAAKAEIDRRVERAERGAGNQEWLFDPSGLPAEILRRVVDRLVRHVEEYAVADHAGPAPSGPELTRFIERLRRGETATLGHVLARPGPRWRFMVAPPRRT